MKLQLKKLAGATPLRLMLIVVLATVAVWGFSATETPVYSLFQSSVQTSTVATPTPPPPPPPPTNTPVPPPPAPTDTPVPPAAPTSAPEQPAPQPTPVPTDTPATIQGGAVPQPQQTQPEASPTVPVSETEPAVLQPIEPTTPPPTAESPAPAPEGGRVVNQVKLIDTVVEWLAYGWMCLGAMALVLVAGFFAYIHNRGKKLDHDAE